MLSNIFKIAVCCVFLSFSTGAFAQIKVNVGGLKDKIKKKNKAPKDAPAGKETNPTPANESDEKPETKQVKQESEVIFTKRFYPNFDAAKPNAVQEVSDGDSLWLHVKLAKPLKNYVYTQKVTNNDGSVKSLHHFQLGIGAQGDENDYDEVKIWVGKEFDETRDGMIPASYLEKNEFQLSLTAFKKNLCTKLFLSIVGTGEAGTWKNEIRFYRGIIEAGADNPALGAGKVTCNLENGLVKYRKMWEMFNEVLEKGTAEENVLPQKGNFEDATLKNLIINDLKNHNLAFNKVYFAKGWIDYNTSTGGRLRKAQAVYTYKKEGRCFFGFAYPTQEYNHLSGTWTPIKIEYEGNGFPITCDKL